MTQSLACGGSVDTWQLFGPPATALRLTPVRRLEGLNPMHIRRTKTEVVTNPASPNGRRSSIWSLFEMARPGSRGVLGVAVTSVLFASLACSTLAPSAGAQRATAEPGTLAIYVEQSEPEVVSEALQRLVDDASTRKVTDDSQLLAFDISHVNTVVDLNGNDDSAPASFAAPARTADERSDRTSGASVLLAENSGGEHAGNTETGSKPAEVVSAGALTAPTPTPAPAVVQPAGAQVGAVGGEVEVALTPTPTQAPDPVGIDGSGATPGPEPTPKPTIYQVPKTAPRADRAVIVRATTVPTPEPEDDEADDETASEAEEDAADEPTPDIAAEPTPVPTVGVTPEPTVESTPEPIEEPTPVPTVEATPEPTPVPTVEPTPVPTVETTPEPTVEPTAEPTPEPTAEPTTEPTPVPTVEATPEPTVEPTAEPTPVPTVVGDDDEEPDDEEPDSEEPDDEEPDDEEEEEIDD